MSSSQLCVFELFCFKLVASSFLFVHVTMAAEAAARAEASHRDFMDLFTHDPFETLQGEPPEAASANPAGCSPSPERPKLTATEFFNSTLGPSTPRPDCQPFKRAKIDACELADLRAEGKAAKDLNIPWQQRGPPGPPKDIPHATWRGQRWREGSQRWANNGGTNRDWYKHYHSIKKQNNRAAMQTFLEENHAKFRQSETAKGPKELREFLASRSRPSSARAP